MIGRRGALGVLGAGALATALPSFAASQAYDDPDPVYAALASQPAMILPQGAGGRIRLVFADGAPGLDRAPVLAWIARAAAAMTAYYGRFPMADFGLLVVAEPGSDVHHATTYGHQGSACRIGVGIETTAALYNADWKLPHEMCHGAYPNLPRRALWVQEGNATYVEPFARAAAGQLGADYIWRETILGMRKGLRPASDGGLNGTNDHGRLYWGGATFWLILEVAIFEATGGRRSLREALTAINRASGGNTAFWKPEAAMAAGDAAIGGDVMAREYGRFADGAVAVDLDAIFARLGVGLRDGGIAYDDAAPLAGLRKRLTATV